MDIIQGKKYDFTIIGGDKRQVYIAEILAEKGYGVIVYALDSSKIPKGCEQAEKFAQAILETKNIILPIPMISDNKILCKTAHTDVRLEILKQNIDKTQSFFGGCIPNELGSFFDKNGVQFYDFMKEDSIAVFNSIATAEGIIAEAIMRNPINLHNSTALILGYGKCGKIIADKLKALSVNTMVCIRNSTQAAMADAGGHQITDYENLPQYIGKFDFIFNSVPSIVLDNKLLKLVKQTVMIFDIASLPGGVDYQKAKELGIDANIYLSLPGKYAPKSSAIALTDFIISHQKIMK